MSTNSHESDPLRARLRVLIADDYPDAADSLAKLLLAAGFDVQIARDGGEALERTRAWHPHACVLDLSMPKLNGLEIARWVQGQPWMERPTLIALTGWARPGDQQRALAAGFDHHFAKPAEPEAIMEVLRAARRPRR